MVILVPFGLIGDVTGTIPVIIAGAKKCLARKEEMFVACHHEAEPIMAMIPKRYEVRLFSDWAANGQCGKVYAINLPEAFHFSNGNGRSLYMSQAYYHTIGWPVPFKPERPELELDPTPVRTGYDFGLAPFARSLPIHQKWPQSHWQALVNQMPDKQFVLFGAASRGDDPEFVVGPNVSTFFDHPLDQVARMIRDLREGLISVSTGPSHIAYAVGTRNFLIINQGPFAKNPDAIVIDKNIPDLTVAEVLDVIRAHERQPA